MNSLINMCSLIWIELHEIKLHIFNLRSGHPNDFYLKFKILILMENYLCELFEYSMSEVEPWRND